MFSAPMMKFYASVLMMTGLFARSAMTQDSSRIDRNSPAKVKTIRTIGKEDFRESLRDRLSGGLGTCVPFRMATDSRGRILVTEPFAGRVQVLDTREGRRYAIRGDKAQRLEFPTYIAVDADDNIYVSEPLSGAISVYSPYGHFLRSIGGAHLHTPFGLAVDAANRKLYVADHFRSEIQVYSLDGQFMNVISSRGYDPGRLRAPSDLVLHDGVLFVLDTGNARFQMFDLAGNSKGVTPFDNDGWPVAFALDRAGNLYYVDMESQGLQVANAVGNLIAALDAQLAYGQPGRRATYPSFTSVVESPDGNVLALSPALKVEEVRLEPVATISREEQSQR